MKDAFVYLAVLDTHEVFARKLFMLIRAANSICESRIQVCQPTSHENVRITASPFWDALRLSNRSETEVQNEALQEEAVIRFYKGHDILQGATLLLDRQVSRLRSRSQSRTDLGDYLCGYCRSRYGELRRRLTGKNNHRCRKRCRCRTARQTY